VMWPLENKTTDQGSLPACRPSGKATHSSSGKLDRPRAQPAAHDLKVEASV